jgi:hypothetical protein
MARSTTADVPRTITQRKLPHPKKASATNVDDERDSSEMEEGTDTPEEATWDGLVRPDGSPVVVFLWADIPRDARKTLQRQIEVRRRRAILESQPNMIWRI